jgi:hypothetical protein
MPPDAFAGFVDALAADSIGDPVYPIDLPRARLRFRASVAHVLDTRNSPQAVEHSPASSSRGPS